MSKLSDIIASIPRGTASDRLTKGCLVLEGGAFRGLYTQGFLDAMMENDLNLQCVIGVSAGALAGVNYVSGQIGRSARVNLAFRRDGRYIGVRALLNSHSLLDVGFLTEDRGIIEPLDHARFDRPEQRFVAVATDCLTGKPTYFEKGKCKDIFRGVRASATIPFFSPMLKIDGVPYLDGVCACKVPYQWAIDEGFEKIVVIRTRDASFRAVEPKNPTPPRMYRRYPALAALLTNSDRDYNIESDKIAALAESGRILHLTPSRPVSIGLIERRFRKLYDLYLLGYNDCLAELDRIKAYLA